LVLDEDEESESEAEEEAEDGREGFDGAFGGGTAVMAGL
jgi:hypothetical protein